MLSRFGWSEKPQQMLLISHDSDGLGKPNPPSYSISLRICILRNSLNAFSRVLTHKYYVRKRKRPLNNKQDVAVLWLFQPGEGERRVYCIECTGPPEIVQISMKFTSRKVLAMQSLCDPTRRNQPKAFENMICQYWHRKSIDDSCADRRVVSEWHWGLLLFVLSSVCWLKRKKSSWHLMLSSLFSCPTKLPGTRAKHLNCLFKALCLLSLIRQMSCVSGN